MLSATIDTLTFATASNAPSGSPAGSSFSRSSSACRSTSCADAATTAHHDEARRGFTRSRRRHRGRRAASLAVFSGLHLTGAIHAGDRSGAANGAGIVEAMICVVLLVATFTLIRWPGVGRRIGLSALVLAIAGFIVGLTFTARGGQAKCRLRHENRNSPPAWHRRRDTSVAGSATHRSATNQRDGGSTRSAIFRSFVSSVSSVEPVMIAVASDIASGSRSDGCSARSAAARRAIARSIEMTAMLAESRNSSTVASVPCCSGRMIVSA
jgi:hypothetical protein